MLRQWKQEKMKAEIFSFLVLTAGLLVTDTTGTETCVTPRLSGTMRVSLSSRRNQTGHWLAQVKLEKVENIESAFQTSSPLHLELEQSTALCGGSSASLITATITAPPQPPGPGYRLIPGMGYYKFHPDSEIWSKAKAICASENAHLAIINSPEESAVLRDLFAEHPSLKDVMYNEYAFIGFHDLNKEGYYVTIFDQPLNSTGFMVWSGGQPDDAGNNEDCGSIHRNGLLNDLICSRKHAFICEQELN